MSAAELGGKVAVVTGGGRGTGRACALALAQAGADVAILARTRAELEETAAGVRALSRRALTVPCDVAESAQVTRAVTRVREELGPTLILVAAAGIARSAKFTDISDEEWDDHLRINASGAFYAARAAVPDMVTAGWGRVVMIASISARVPALYTAAYTASKHALLGLTRALALEYARKGITANAICPGWLDTAMTAQSIANIAAKTKRTPDEARRVLEEMSPQRRLFTPEEVADLTVYLCSEAARAINGQGIVLDGGSVMP
ncbi:MAG: SDR family oxidoreductase [Armatimonadetes bacterium]|nr:SDR family oxidoreductase [Armatimonadota bacterium]